MSIGDLIEKFRGVALDRLEKMNVLLVELERDPTAPSIEELTREIHTLKGEAKMMGFADVNLVSHLTEHLMLDAAAVGFQVSDRKTELMFEGLDILGALLTKAAGGATAPIDLTGFVDRVSEARQTTDEASVEADEKPVAPEDLDEPPSTEPPVTESGQFDAQPRTVRSKVVDSSLLRIQTSGSTRVDLGKLERLGEATGEVLLTARRLGYQLNDLERLRDDYLEIRGAIEPLLPKSMSSRTRTFGHRLDALLGELRGHTVHVENWGLQLDAQTRDLRHTPLDQALQHYPRAVRDLAASQGKKVRLIQEVTGVEVDRIVLNGLADPLLHLVRNAVDHGLETPAEREASGKSEEGVLRLAADYAGDSVRVVLSDDGRGIDPRLIARKAVERGIASGSDVASMTDAELLGLIFEAGFSTRDEVTDVSGRGIGMDVVRRQIGAIGGTVELESEVGRGTTFTLVLPISSAVGSVLTFVVAGHHFALPAKDIERVEFVDYADLARQGETVQVPWEDELIPLVDWNKLLGKFSRQTPRGRLTVMFVQRGGRRVALWVDDIFGEREAMTRPLGQFLAGLRMCRGIAITDAGEMVPLLSVNELLSAENLTSTDMRHSVRATLELPRPPRQRKVLVVEDSEITRALVSGILRSLDVTVVEAEDGWIGWERLNEQRFDLVMTDVQMPRMSGLELLEKMRGEERFDAVPIVILTTLGETADKERALKLGADAYLVKLNFEEAELIRTVERLLG